uniref:DUF4371 domain-containing protein n=1 Tax=Latimeria chalumnae TaxID=7897 RepID=H3A5Y3_LATCH
DVKMPLKRKSGAQKRKQKKEELLLAAKLPKISSFFQSVTEPDNAADKSESDTEQDSGPSTVAKMACAETNFAKKSEQEPDIESILKKELGKTSAALNSEEPAFPPADDKNPTDRGNFPLAIKDSQKRYIISQGPCKPNGPFPQDKNQEGRCFSTTYYDITTKAEVKLTRTWLCYSPKLDSAYCEPCWLFADCSAPAYDVAWVSLSSKIEYHETSKIHLDFCLVYEQWQLHGTIDEDFETQIQKEKNFWRQVLERLINVTLTLSMCNLAFRGHREVLGHANSGNFLLIMELLAKYDPVLKQLVSMPSGSIRYLSHTIQDELIEILSKRIEGNIVEEIKAAPFFSVIMDTTQNISKTDQLSQIFRYVTIETDERNVATGVKINESFQEICDQSTSGLEKKIISCIEQKGLDISKCRGQGYDGASNMSGVYSGVQARISKKELHAEYVHCAAHNLNLTLNDSVRGIPKVKHYYDVIERLYTFFSHSIKRWAIIFIRFYNITLKRLCPTRWSSRYESLLALRFRYLDIMKALTKIVLLSKNADKHCEASALKKLMENLNFVFLVVLQTKILEVKLLQSKDTDLYKAAKLLCKATEDLAIFQNNFKAAKNSTIKLSEKWGGQTKFQEKRVRKVKRHFDKLCEDERLADSESFFKVNVLYRCLDIINAQLTNRFQSLQTVADKFSVIQPNTLISASDEDLYKEAEKLANHFNK